MENKHETLMKVESFKNIPEELKMSASGHSAENLQVFKTIKQNTDPFLKIQFQDSKIAKRRAESLRKATKKGHITLQKMKRVGADIFIQAQTQEEKSPRKSKKGR